MDFKTELQNLVNRYSGMIKKVKIEFVKDIEVTPNEAPIVPQAAYIPQNNPTIQPINRLAVENLPNNVSLGPNGEAIKGAKPLPVELAQAQGAALGAVQAAIAAAKARTGQV